MDACKAIIFDLDGTLINSLPYHLMAFKDMMLEHGIRVGDSHLKRLIGMPTTGILKDLKKRYGFRENVDDLREERRYHYFKFLGSRNIVFPGAMRVLQDLHAKYKLAIATGSSRIIFTHSTGRDFQQLFDAVVTINDVREGKPEPDEFLLAARRLHEKPGHCVAVGDSIYDAIAAGKAGVHFIGVATGYHSRKQLLGHGAITVIRSLKELDKALSHQSR